MPARSRSNARPGRPVAVLVALVSVLAALAGCIGVPPPATPPLSGRLSIGASTSLTEIIDKVTDRFTTAHPGVDIDVAFDSGGLEGPLDAVVLEGTALPNGLSATATSTVVARNQLVLAVAPGDPKGLAGLRDLARPGLRVVLCEASAVCGKAAQTVLAAAKVNLPAPRRVADTHVAWELVAQGMADAALVYRTDTRPVEDKVATIEFGESRLAPVDYHAVVLAGSANPAAAAAFVAFLSTPAAREVLAEAGFQLP